MDSFTNNRIYQIDFDGAVSVELLGNSKKIVLTATQNCYIKINTDAVLATSGFFIPANTAVTLPIALVDKIVAIKESSAGKLTIMELF